MMDMMIAIRKDLLKRLAIIGAVLTLCGFTTTTLDPDKTEIVTTDVDHFWQAFDAATKVPAEQRAQVYTQEYFDKGGQGFKDFIAYRHVTPEKLAEHVEQSRGHYAEIRPYIGNVVGQKPVIAAAFKRLKALDPDAGTRRSIGPRCADASAKIPVADL